MPATATHCPYCSLQCGILNRLRALDLLVVSDIFLSETAALADVVLPVAQWAEEDGTMTNVEGRVIRRRCALPPPPEVRTDLAVLADLAGRLGSGRHFSAEPRTVFEELRRASAGGIADYAGISYERSTPTRLGSVDDIPLGEGRACAVDGEVVAVFRLRDGSLRPCRRSARTAVARWLTGRSTAGSWSVRCTSTCST